MADQIVPNLSDLAEESSQIRVTLMPSYRPNVLAAVIVELETDLGTISIHDGRILKNKAGALWCALPSYSIQEGKGYRYEPTITLSNELRRQIENLALAAFEEEGPRQGAAE